jgi:hypothetical protein
LSPSPPRFPPWCFDASGLLVPKPMEIKQRVNPG